MFRSDVLARLTGEEKSSWLILLEAEERQRLQSLSASLDAFGSQRQPTPAQVNDLLVSALQGQTTLMRMSRVFPAFKANRLLDAEEVLHHPLTCALAGHLRRSWTLLGVKDSAVGVLLRRLLASALSRRRLVFSQVQPLPDAHQTAGPASKARQRFAVDGPGQSRPTVEK